MELNYAQNQGMVLLNHVVRTIGPIFTIDQARELVPNLGIMPQRVAGVLSQLARSGWLARIKRGVYTVQSPTLGTEIHPYAIADALVEPVAISHWSALAYHGLTEQIPPMIQASTPSTVVTPEMRSGQAYSPRGRAAWRVLGWEFEFVQVKRSHFFGFQQQWVSQWHRVRITDLERTILDMVASPHIFGSLRFSIETCEMHLGRLDLDKLVAYALQYAVGAVIKRLGWILETLGVSDMSIAPLQTYSTQSYYILDPTGPSKGTVIARWNLYHNL
ncbi:MAG: type IV toxin-antitoxin system AbiEi family antitoxin domain-containing protein [Anaerolineae bacterium]|nr:type IV toxin-antitoxin system AbiEi family antitoxin domain-containing protein [Anaerolineae bacterium]